MSSVQYMNSWDKGKKGRWEDWERCCLSGEAADGNSGSLPPGMLLPLAALQRALGTGGQSLIGKRILGSKGLNWSCEGSLHSSARGEVHLSPSLLLGEMRLLLLLRGRRAASAQGPAEIQTFSRCVPDIWNLVVCCLPLTLPLHGIFCRICTCRGGGRFSLWSCDGVLSDRSICSIFWTIPIPDVSLHALKLGFSSFGFSTWL